MSVATYLAGIEASRNTIRTKLVELGLAQSSDKLAALAEAVEDITDRGAVNATVREGDTYTIPAGYHNGSGRVSGVAGGGSYTLQAKTVTPSGKQQSVTPDEGFYGLSAVTVAAIPGNYKDVSAVTARAADVLAGKVFVTADGTVTAGEMLNNGAVEASIDGLNVTSYSIPAGFHSGSGRVALTDDIENALAAI